MAKDTKTFDIHPSNYATIYSAGRCPTSSFTYTKPKCIGRSFPSVSSSCFCFTNYCVSNDFAIPTVPTSHCFICGANAFHGSFTSCFRCCVSNDFADFTIPTTSSSQCFICDTTIYTAGCCPTSSSTYTKPKCICSSFPSVSSSSCFCFTNYCVSNDFAIPTASTSHCFICGANAFHGSFTSCFCCCVSNDFSIPTTSSSQCFICDANAFQCSVAISIMQPSSPTTHTYCCCDAA